MRISARVEHSVGEHRATVATNGSGRAIAIPPRDGGYGSSANGGELLFLALATCSCNDVYREAGRQGIAVERVELEVDGEFGGPGDPARNVTYRVRIAAQASAEQIRALATHTDTVAEIQNTLRVLTPVGSAEVEAVVAEP